MTASSLVLRTRRRSSYQGHGDLHQARAAAAEEKHLATLAKPRMVSSQVQLCVYSALHMDHLSRGGSFADPPPRTRGHAPASGPVSSSLELIFICKTMDKIADTSESS